MKPRLSKLGFIALTSIFLISCEDKKTIEPVVRPVKTMVVGEVNNKAKRAFPGRAIAVQEVNLSFKVGGLLVAFPIQIGDVVKKDQLIAQLDAREFRARLNAARAELTRDEENFRRAQRLITRGHISQADFELLKTKAALAKSSVDLAQKALTDTVINAPFAGRIASTPVRNHQTVTANQVIARLLDTSYIDMVIQIPETIISTIPSVNTISVQFDAFPNHHITAKVKEISNEASMDTRTYPVTLTMKQSKDIEILPGMAGSATLYLSNQGHADSTKLTVPESAIFTHGPERKSFVWVIDRKNQTVHQKPVVLGEFTATGVSITGLTQGDIVVTAGVRSLREGDEVTLLNPEDE